MLDYSDGVGINQLLTALRRYYILSYLYEFEKKKKKFNLDLSKNSISISYFVDYYFIPSLFNGLKFD